MAAGFEIQLLNANQPTANFIAPTVPVISGSQTLTFELTVTDNQGAITVDSVDITVIPVMFISDISPLSNLTSLSYLVLNKIVDINPVTNLTALANLGLSHNKVSDLLPLANLTT